MLIAHCALLMKMEEQELAGVTKHSDGDIWAGVEWLCKKFKTWCLDPGIYLLTFYHKQVMFMTKCIEFNKNIYNLNFGIVFAYFKFLHLKNWYLVDFELCIKYANVVSFCYF